MKKTIASILAVLMLVSLLPASALAAAIDAGPGETVEVSENVESIKADGATVKVDGKVTGKVEGKEASKIEVTGDVGDTVNLENASSAEIGGSVAKNV